MSDAALAEVLASGTLHAGWAQRDRQTFTAAVAVQLLVLARAPLRDDEWWRVATLACGMSVLLACMRALRPQFVRWRTPIICATRVVVMLVPVAVLDMPRALQPSAARAAPGHPRADPASLLHAASVLMSLAYVDGCVLATVGNPLPPLQHTVLHAAGVAALMWRTPHICGEFVARQHSNGVVVRGLYRLMALLASVWGVGTREHLAVSAAALDAAAQCTAVAWALQASLGFVVPTLLILRQTLAALKLAARRRGSGGGGPQQRGARGVGNQPGSRCEGAPPAPPGKRPSLPAAQVWLLQAADGVGSGWPLLAAGSALLAFLAGTARLHPA